MNGKRLTILRAHASGVQGRYTRVAIRSAWLADAGFVPGLSVCAVPMCDGFTATLQNNKNSVRGKLFRIGLMGDKHPSLIIDITRNFPMPEIFAGDFLAAAYEHGRITAKKLPPADRYYVIDSHCHAAHLKLGGDWLNDTGFPPDTIATVATEDGKITIHAVQNNSPANYGDIVKYARARKLQITQSRKHDDSITLALSDRVLGSAGFAVGDICGVRCNPGVISLFKPDFIPVLTTTA